MKFKYGENVLLAILFLFLELIKRCYPLTIEKVNPLVIKINKEKLEVIPIIILLNETIENRKDQILQLRFQNFTKEIIAIEEDKQDKNKKKKIEFKFNQSEFVDQYGKYEIFFENAHFNETIFIYANDIILKNPKKNIS